VPYIVFEMPLVTQVTV